MPPTQLIMNTNNCCAISFVTWEPRVCLYYSSESTSKLRNKVYY